MNTNLIPTAKRGAFACGRDLGMPWRADTTPFLAAPIAGVTGENSVLVHAYPGTPVWRPPSC